MPKKRNLPAFRVVLLGNKNVGKYSLREQFIKGWIAPKDFEAPPGPASKTLTLDKQKVEVTVSCLKDLQNPQEAKGNCDGIILVYNITDKTSMDFIKTQGVSFLERNSNPSNEEDEGNGANPQGTSIPLLLVGNKADEAKLSRNLSFEDGQKLSNELGCVGFFETSATCLPER